MSDLSKMDIDPNIPENEGSFTVLPAAKYKVVIVGTNIKDTKAKDGGKIFVVKSQIIEGEYNGFLIREDNINIKNKNKVCQEIGQGILKRICRLTEVSFPPPDTTLMHGKPLMVTVGVDEYIDENSGEKKKSNKIMAYNEFKQEQKKPDNQNNNNNFVSNAVTTGVVDKSELVDEEDPW